jgi:hypothetical protein
MKCQLRLYPPGTLYDVAGHEVITEGAMRHREQNLATPFAGQLDKGKDHH